MACGFKVVAPLGNSNLYLYNFKGEFLLNLNDKYWPGVHIPTLPISQYYITGDMLYLVFGHIKKIYILNLSGYLEKIIPLNFNKETYDVGSPNVFMDITDKNYLIFTENNSFKGLSDLFENSKFLTKFDSLGKKINQFGKYPKSYTTGGQNVEIFRHANITKLNDKIIVVHSLGKPQIDSYDLHGQLLQNKSITLLEHDEEIHFFNDYEKITPNDQIVSLITSDVQNEILLVYRYFENNKQDHALKSQKYRLVKHNLVNGKSVEYDIGENRPFLLNMKNQVVTYLFKSREIEKTYMVKARLGDS